MGNIRQSARRIFASNSVLNLTLPYPILFFYFSYFIYAHCIQLGWVEMPVSEQEKANEAIEDNEDEDE
jgi:hypothetical protein